MSSDYRGGLGAHLAMLYTLGDMTETTKVWAIKLAQGSPIIHHITELVRFTSTSLADEELATTVSFRIATIQNNIAEPQGSHHKRFADMLHRDHCEHQLNQHR